MRVLYVAHYFLPNLAAGVTTEEIIKMLFRKGHEVTLIAPSTYMMDTSRVQEYRGIITLKPAFTAIPKWVAQRSKLVSMLAATLGYIAVFVTGLKTARREAPFDVIIGQYHTFHLATLTSFVLSILTKTPLVIKIHDIMPCSPTRNKLEFIYSTMLSNLNRWALARASRILSPSTEIAETLTKLGVKKARVVFFPNTVDLRLFSSGLHTKEFRDSLGLSGGKIVLFMANAFEDRGLDAVLKALTIVNDKHTMLVVIGPCSRKYRKLAQQLQVSSKTVFTGEVDHELIPKYIHMADVCVGPLIASPYTYGVVPRKVIEYMACGKPVIVAKGAVTDDLVSEGKSALLINSYNEGEVAQAIVSLMNDEIRANKISSQAQKVIAKNYSTEKLADTLNETLKELASS